MQQDYQPTAPAPNGQGAPDAVLPAAAPSGADSGAPPVVQMPKEQRDQLAQMGRQLAEAKRDAANARAQVQQVSQRLSQRDQQDWQSYLASLPPDQRAVAEARGEAQIANQRLSALEAQLRPPQRPQITPEQQRERAQELLERVAQETGVRLHGSEDALDWQGEREFYASARAIALTRRSAPPETTESADQLPPAQTPNFAASRPLSPQPQGSGRGVVTEDDLARTMWMKNPAARKKALQEQREAAYRQGGVELGM